MVRKVSAIAALVLAGCGGAAIPPPELTAARTAYGQTTNSPASQYAPEQVLAAREALDRAEASWKKHGASEETRTLAYVAHRKAEIARSAGRIGVDQHNIQQAARDLAEVEAELLQRAARATPTRRSPSPRTSSNASAARRPSPSASRRRRSTTSTTSPASDTPR